MSARELDVRAQPLARFDGRDYALMVTVRADNGLVEIQHQATSDRAADRQMARLAADIIDQIGPEAVAAQLQALCLDVDADDLRPGITVTPPARGTAVLACRCGAVIDAADMRRRPRYGGHPIAPIVCQECAA